MADYAQIEVELKGVKYTTEATDSAGILFLSILFNEDETLLIRQGRMEDALTIYSDRAASRMKQEREAIKDEQETLFQLLKTLSEEEHTVVEAKLQTLNVKSKQIDERLSNEIMMELWQRIERSNSVRSLIAKRIKELFRFAEPNPIPERLVFWNSDEDNGINLSASDLLALFTAIVGPTLADIKKNKSDTEKIEATPVEAAPEPVKVETLAPVTADHNDLLREQRAAIEKLLNSNPEPDMRKVLGDQLANIDAQLVG